MRKFLGVSLVAVLAVSPMMAQADVATVSTNDTTVGVASTKYVKEAYNAMAAAVNTELGGKANSSDLTGKANVGLDNLSTAGTTVITNNVKSNAAVGTYNSSTNYASGTIGAAIKTANTTAGNAADKNLSNLSTTGTGVITTNVTTNAAKGTYSASGTYDTGTIGKALQGKQETISDLATIRSGAAAGATALQSGSALNGANLTAGTVAKTALASGVQTSLGKADTAVQSVTTGTEQMANGTISVDGTAVAVKGLGSAAYTASTAYDAAGAAAAVENKLDDGASGYDIDAKTLKVQGTSVLTSGSSLNGAKLTAGTVAKTALATAVQTSLGKADTALQSNSALNGANLTTGSVPTAALADGAVTAAKLGAEIQLYSGWNSGGTPTANATTVALVAPVHGS